MFNLTEGVCLFARQDMSVSEKTHGSKRQPYDRIYEQSGRNQSVDGNGGGVPVHGRRTQRIYQQEYDADCPGKRATAEEKLLKLTASR